MLLSVVLPAFNEELGLEKTIVGIPLNQIAKRGYAVEKIVVDNNSIDQTAIVARKLGATVLKEKRQGYGYAIQKGLNHCRGELILVCDADASYIVEEVPELIDIFINNDLDFLNTNRFTAGYLRLKIMPFPNRIANYFLSAIFRLLYNLDLKDSQSGMFLLKRSLWSKLRVRSINFSFSQEIKIEAIYYEKCKWLEMDVGYRQRSGKSKLKKIIHGFQNLIFLFEKKIYR